MPTGGAPGAGGPDGRTVATSNSSRAAVWPNAVAAATTAAHVHWKMVIQTGTNAAPGLFRASAAPLLKLFAHAGHAAFQHTDRGHSQVFQIQPRRGVGGT